MLFNALSTVALLLTTITGADALRSNRHHRGLESRHHAAHVPANKRSFTFSANATAGEQIGKRRIEEGAEGIDPSNSTAAALEKRAFGGMRATFYAIGLGACGQYNSEPDYVVALNSAQYGGGYPGPECFKYITITGGPKNGHAVARIMDECPTCPYGGLDMSIALFEQFATQDDGVASVTWWYNDDAPAPTTQAPPPPPPTTSQTPTSTWVAPSPTSTTPAWTPPAPTSTWQAPSSSNTPSSSSVWQAPTTTSTWVAPTTSSTSTWQAPSSSSSWSSSSSAWTSSSAPASSSSSLATSSTGRAISASVTDLVKTSTRVSSASASLSTSAPATTSSLSDGSGSDDNSSVGDSVAASNLDLLSTYTAQLGSLVVVAAQMVIS